MLLAPTKRRASIIRILAGGGEAAEGLGLGEGEGEGKDEGEGEGEAGQPNSRRGSEVRMMASRFRYMAVGDVHCMVLSKADFDRTVAEHDPSIGVFFESERVRLEEEGEEEEGEAGEEDEQDVSGHRFNVTVRHTVTRAGDRVTF